MKKYKMRVVIRNEYEVELLADSVADAEAMAEDCNPADIGEYIDTDRETEIMDEDDILDVLHVITGSDWWVGTPGGNGVRWVTELTEKAVLFIADADDHTELPESLDDMVNVVLATGHDASEHETMWKGTLRDLLEDERDALEDIASEATVRHSTCTNCGLSLEECSGASAYTDQVKDDVSRLIQILGDQNPMVESLRVVLDGFLTNSVPECAGASRA